MGNSNTMTATAISSTHGPFWRPCAPLRVAPELRSQTRLAAALVAAICAFTLLLAAAPAASSLNLFGTQTGVAAQTNPAQGLVGFGGSETPAAVGPSSPYSYYAVSGCCVAPSAARLSQDVAVNPRAPAALPTNRSVGRASHNQALQTDIANLPAGATDIRVNQQQVNAAGQRVGINRPDLQYTVNGQRYYVEYEGPANPRGPAHTTRITANDPAAIVTVRLTP